MSDVDLTINMIHRSNVLFKHPLENMYCINLHLNGYKGKRMI